MNLFINSLKIFMLKAVLYAFGEGRYKYILARSLPSRSMCESSNMSANNYHIKYKRIDQIQSYCVR